MVDEGEGMEQLRRWRSSAGSLEAWCSSARRSSTRLQVGGSASIQIGTRAAGGSVGGWVAGCRWILIQQIRSQRRLVDLAGGWCGEENEGEDGCWDPEERSGGGSTGQAA